MHLTKKNLNLMKMVALAICMVIVSGEPIEGEPPDEDALNLRIEYYQKQLDGNLPEVDAAMLEKARRSACYTQSSQFKKQVDRYKATVTRQLNLRPQQETPERPKPAPGQNERLIIFISSSMPMDTLRGYASILDGLDPSKVSMTLNGFVGDSSRIRQTMDFVNDILIRQTPCDSLTSECDMYKAVVNIDPLLFRTFKITAVPTVVYCPDVTVADQALSLGAPDNLKGMQAFRITGEVPLEYALDRLAERKQGPLLSELVKKARNRGYYGDQR